MTQPQRPLSRPPSRLCRCSAVNAVPSIPQSRSALVASAFEAASGPRSQASVGRHERLLRPQGGVAGQDRGGVLAQERLVLVGSPAALDRQRQRGLDEEVVEERRSCLEAVGHRHPVDLDHEVLGNPHREVRGEGTLDAQVAAALRRVEDRVGRGIAGVGGHERRAAVPRHDGTPFAGLLADVRVEQVGKPFRDRADRGAVRRHAARRRPGDASMMAPPAAAGAGADCGSARSRRTARPPLRP